jgi:hypothetical protein
LQLRIAGRVGAPVVSGKIRLNDGLFAINKEATVERINGVLNIKKNNIGVKHLEGQWNGAVVGISGDITIY